MNKKAILFGVIILVVFIIGFVFLGKKEQKNSLQTPVSMTAEKEVSAKVVPSETFIEYSDPSGFLFNYPDNLSITNNEITDNSTYTDIQLYAKGVNGSLSLNISDTKLKTLQEWLKENQISANIIPKDVKLGNMKAIEVKTTDRLMLAAIDQGILFTIEMPLIEEDFWMKVYEKVVSDFRFNAPSSQNSTGGAINSQSDDVSFEGEEVVE